MTDREKVIKGLDEVWEYMNKKLLDIGSRKVRMMDKVADACNFLKEQGAVVRCKDCKHWGEYECHITNLTGQKSKRDWFCADGKRRTDDA